jgi:hypothetical protein
MNTTMSEQVFEPKNELERQLLAAMMEEISSEQFMDDLMAAQIFMPVQDDDSGIIGFQRSTKATPLVVQDASGLSALVLFTSPERALAFVKDYPGFNGGLLTEFTWVLERMEQGMAIVVNPGLEIGIDIEPETVSRMMMDLASKAGRM